MSILYSKFLSKILKLLSDNAIKLLQKGDTKLSNTVFENCENFIKNFGFEEHNKHLIIILNHLGCC